MDNEEWQKWCRLCGQEESKNDIFIKDENCYCISDSIARFLGFTITSFDIPSNICDECYQSIQEFIEFKEQCLKVQQMYCELRLTTSEIDYINLRKKYGLEEKIKIIKQDPDQYNEADEILELKKRKKLTRESIDKDINFDEQLVSYNVHKEDQDHDDDFNETVENISNEFLQSLPIDEHKKQLSLNAESESNKKSNDRKSCKFCGKTFSRIKFLKKHEKFHLEKRNENSLKTLCKPKLLHTCEICQKIFFSAGGLTIHMKVKHAIKKIPHTCKVCGKSFERLSQLDRHENAHLPSEERKQLSCPHCDKKFNSESGRWSHIHTVHDKKKAVICEECGKEFSTKHHLVNHKLSHSQEKNLQCSKCPAKFKGKVGLSAHMEIHGESLPCSICGVLLNTKQLLKKHMIVHSDIKKFKCNFCNKDFKRSKELNYHLITHIGIKPFECRICNQKFVHDMTYRRHLKATHPNEYSQMVANGERISNRNFPPPDQLKAINEAAKCTHNFTNIITKEEIHINAD